MRWNRRTGLTLIEVLIAVTILGSVLAAVTMFGRTASDTVNMGTVQTDVGVRLRRTLSRIEEEFLPSGLGLGVLDVPQFPLFSESVVYQKSNGAPTGRIVWGPQNRIAFEYEQGELDDGVDNNGDGLVDEGVVVWTRDVGGPNEQSVVWCRGVSEYLEGEVPNGVDDNGNGLVDERGLSMVETGNRVSIYLTVVRLDRNGKQVLETLDASVRPRNQPPVSSP